METNFINIIFCIAIGSGIFFRMYKLTSFAFPLNLLLSSLFIWGILPDDPSFKEIATIGLYLGCPLLLINTVLYVFIPKKEPSNIEIKYQVQFKTQNGRFQINNVKRGVSVIGAAGSGKTESVVYNLLDHFSRNSFCGLIHDYKDFEITEMAYPLFRNRNTPSYILSFDKIIHRVNPIAPRYMVNEEDINEVSRVLIENLLEQKETGATGINKFFNDAAQGLISGLIWKLKVSFPEYCTLPHLIAIYQNLDTDELIDFLKSNQTSRAFADAFISGKDSERQTAGVKSTLSTALMKISSKRIFMALAADDIPLNINNPQNPAVISLINNPKYDSSYSPIIATIMHTIVKQMSVRHSRSSFLLIEEAPTIRLLNMHRIPATLRSYDIATVYVMQDKIQNDMMYGDKASKAILSNLSYQFFGKVNDPDTARFYERFFEIIKDETKTVMRGTGLDFDTKISTGEKEIYKVRANVFFSLKQGEFITYADGIDKKVQFKQQNIKRELPDVTKFFSEEDINENYIKIYREVRSICKDKKVKKDLK
ncbi:type IV secretion system DNA-binding domain-containing protein [Salegentibacter sp. LM13S]|uniref:type IV secretory system conjugative DNA transfer family protein n=1 Tax=Salegentibacter lacus TaxID=2873599 RepID=UPI001CCEA041|nr:type IV secretion system DNA-binding domain-containing protein [Salegentibacter lacus]MBZ9632187.1 type IV secretion system DNA-binding domain-containing protein [Salegentibacter lacus]